MCHNIVDNYIMAHTSSDIFSTAGSCVSWEVVVSTHQKLSLKNDERNNIQFNVTQTNAVQWFTVKVHTTAPETC